MPAEVKTRAFRFSEKSPAGERLFILDQTLLPEKELFVPIKSIDEAIAAIKDLKVRGANAIGIVAAFALAGEALAHPERDMAEPGWRLKTARPTAAHLARAVDRVLGQSSPEAKLKEALRIYEEDRAACENIAALSRPLIAKGDSILTYCNTGFLAASGGGTALGAARQAHKDGKGVHVYVCETRPANQGARLTFWELQEDRIPASLICDNMAGHLMAQGKIQKVITGADRISRNGDTANKIGTLSLAVIARHFQVPFYVAAPSSAFDKSLKTGAGIPIEERAAQEISPFWADKKASVISPAFDVTPFSLIDGIVTERGVISSPAELSALIDGLSGPAA